MESSKDLKESRDPFIRFLLIMVATKPTRFVAFGILIGINIGAVLLAITGNTIWLAILPGLGLVVGAALEANRRQSHARS